MVALHETTDQGIAEICGSDRCGDRLISLFCTVFRKLRRIVLNLCLKSCETFLGSCRHETSLHFNRSSV